MPADRYHSQRVRKDSDGVPTTVFQASFVFDAGVCCHNFRCHRTNDNLVSLSQVVSQWTGQLPYRIGV
jgi:hypothetical protein